LQEILQQENGSQVFGSAGTGYPAGNRTLSNTHLSKSEPGPERPVKDLTLGLFPLQGK
jgi:hypothetical protein